MHPPLTTTFQTPNMSYHNAALNHHQLHNRSDLLPRLKPCVNLTLRPSGSSANQKPESLEKLPDASMLLNSSAFLFTSGNDHASMVAAAMADNMSRKRDSKGMMGSGSSNSVTPLPRAKLPRATLTHSKNVPDTGGGTLVPPQLRGRSNVVTEDISKLFVSRHAVAQPRGPENE
ncbi:uncharacterized protein LOC120128995 isoform X1 [Hibiscus syriacus]|uniref:uncharacterized protein LOC120128995 isoform X1 n=1 Tax=Hibiscus syriacus TaxID=106335 RepID=UPI00192132D2|nr:uncharacterized protein LOC120128995 isoform X1 [Hibiscus syriacus]